MISFVAAGRIAIAAGIISSAGSRILRKTTVRRTVIDQVNSNVKRPQGRDDQSHTPGFPWYMQDPYT
jgi:hypothetical protein